MFTLIVECPWNEYSLAGENVHFKPLYKLAGYLDMGNVNFKALYKLVGYLDKGKVKVVSDKQACYYTP